MSLESFWLNPVSFKEILVRTAKSSHIFYTMALQLQQKLTLSHSALSYKFREIFQNTFFTEHLLMIASDIYFLMILLNCEFQVSSVGFYYCYKWSLRKIFSRYFLNIQRNPFKKLWQTSLNKLHPQGLYKNGQNLLYKG